MPSIGRKQTLDDENALWDAEAHLIAAFLWKRATKTGAIASILSGTIVTLLWTFVLDTGGVASVPAGSDLPGGRAERARSGCRESPDSRA